PGVTPMLWAAAAGKIIVAEASYAVSAIVEHQHSALLAKPRDDRALVRRIHRALEDRQLAWAVADAARSEAYSIFSRQRFVSDLRTVHRQIRAGEPVAVPELPSTGGLRFAGRA